MTLQTSYFLSVFLPHSLQLEHLTADIFHVFYFFIFLADFSFTSVRHLSGPFEDFKLLLCEMLSALTDWPNRHLAQTFLRSNPDPTHTHAQIYSLLVIFFSPQEKHVYIYMSVDCTQEAWTYKHKLNKMKHSKTLTEKLTIKTIMIKQFIYFKQKTNL